MDTKLKNNKKNGNRLILFLQICIIVLIASVPIAYTNILYARDKYATQLGYEIGEVDTWVKDLMQYSEDFTGKLREDSIEAEVNSIKSQMESPDGVYYESKYSNRTDEEIKGFVKFDFNNYVDDLINNIKRDCNVEFYYETADNEKPITNTSASSKEEFKEEALKNSKEYILVEDVNNIIVSDNLQNNQYLSEAIGLQPKAGVYIRLASNLKYGDNIYEAVKDYNRDRIIGYLCLVLSIVSFIGIIYAGVQLKTNKNLEYKETFLKKVYRKICIEIRAIIAISVLAYGIDLYTNRYKFNLYRIQHFIALVILYFVVIDIIRLVKILETRKFSSVLKEESLIIKVMNYFIVNSKKYLKESKLLKDTFNKVIAAMVIHTLYNILILIVLFKCIYIYPGALSIIMIMVAAAILLVGNIFILKVGSSLNKIVLGSKRISEGNYDEKIDVKGPIILNEIADNIENIQLGLKDAVYKAVKSEKMKGELITNVSHDLKTPLTSIINYVDLLDQKNVSEEEKEKYIKVLKEKSNRLKVLIEDLFEVSKASSGSMELNMNNIDLVSLLTQTLVELDDKIEASGLKFIKDFPKEKITIYADGRKLFRVFQNLLSNIFKYSMKNSRVYIEVKDNINYVEVTFKNISEYELNFTEEEILQRFKRGDESRTTEGSGLGLSIAKSLVELQRGKFEIHIDGDLFKVIIKLVKDSKLNEEGKDRE